MLLGGTVLLAMTAGTVLAGGPASLDEALTLAAKEQKPVLIDFYAVWCGPCKVFNKDMETDAQVQNATGGFILYKTDAEKEGKELAKKFSVAGYPTYVALNPEGEILERWGGYTKGFFLTRTSGVLADPTTVEQKFARFEAKPTASDAAVLARHHDSRGEYKDAISFYSKAQKLAKDPSTDYSMDIFAATFYGFRDDMFALDELSARADDVFKSKHAGEGDLITTADMMMSAARHEEKPEAGLPYLEGAVERTEAALSDGIRESRTRLLPDYALYVQKDVNQAIAYKKESLGEGWTESPSRLNSFAWWCFENEDNLEEAYEMARKGVELAEPGSDKAQILDTLAEICNARGDCREALQIIQMAIKEDPNREYFKKQEKRFAELLAAEEGKM
jgi:thiol-disulfide isomerase/thioredoxin